MVSVPLVVRTYHLENRMIRTVQTEVRSILQSISEPVEGTINF